jgi:hypothetical protein
LRASPYFCSLCNKESSRKNNALRHNRLVHDEQGEIYDRSNNTIYSPQIPREPYPGYPISKNIVGSVGSNVFNSNGIKLNSTDIYNPQPILKRAKNREDVKSEQDNLFYQEVGKIGHLNEVLEGMLSTYPQDTKKRVSEMMLSCALASQDPKQNYLENLSWFKNVLYSDRFAQCISSFCNVPKSSANEILRNSILRKYREETD